MKYANIITKGLLLISLFTLGQTSLADEIVRPNTAAQVQNSLDEQRLSQAQVIDLFDSSKQTAKATSDLEYFAGLNVAPPPSNEGLPSPTNSDEQGDISSIINNAYSSADLIAQALQERQNMPLGQRIQYLEERATDIIRISANRPTEILLRLTLNRSVDLTHHILPIMGYNTEELARELANFYRENFEMAASFGNNKIGVESRFTTGDQDESGVAHFLRTVSIAEYGYAYANLMWNYSLGLSSGGSKAVILMRMLGYLGWDFNADLRRREKPIAQTIADIYLLQHSPLYQRILNTLASGNEPTQNDTAELRSRIFSIKEKIPARLQEVAQNRR